MVPNRHAIFDACLLPIALLPYKDTTTNPYFTKYRSNDMQIDCVSLFEETFMDTIIVPSVWTDEFMQLFNIEMTVRTWLRLSNSNTLKLLKSDTP